MTDAVTQPSPIKLRWFFGIFGLFLIFVVIAVYSSRMARDTSDYDQQRGAERYATLAKLRAEDEKTLTTADWVDQSKGTVRIPIDEAMPQAVALLKAKPVQMGAAVPGATPVNNTVPAPAPTGAPSATNAPASAPPAPAAPNK